MKNLIFVCVILSHGAFSQISVPFTSPQWEFNNKNYVLEEYQGKQSVVLTNSRATLKNSAFENGIIEYDVAIPVERAFLGVLFRMQDPGNYEEFYLRAHQSGNPDANQYSPVYETVAAWQLYYGEGYATPVKYSFNTWTHVKLLIFENQIEVYIGDMEKPVLFAVLKRPVQKGMLGVQCFPSAGRFANFTYTNTTQVTFKSKAKEATPTPVGTITQWQVSSPFSEKLLENVHSIPTQLKTQLTWKPSAVEITGVLNLASVVKWSQETNTTFARIVIVAEEAQIKKFTFGFSDRVRIYLNDTILFSGEDGFTSRDYRFLGTIGYYDTVYLNLKKGTNELWVAVSETFGGWGVQGKIEDQTNISIAK